jgi:hypothetical protein
VDQCACDSGGAGGEERAAGGAVSGHGELLSIDDNRGGEETHRTSFYEGSQIILIFSVDIEGH